MKTRFIVAAVLAAVCGQTHAVSPETSRSFPKSYDNLSLSYKDVYFLSTGGTRFMNGVGLDYLHGFGVSDRVPVYVEAGIGVSMLFRDTDSGESAAYGYVDVPVNVSYRIGLGSKWSLSPYVGVTFKGNVIGSSDFPDSRIHWYTDEHYRWFQFGWHTGCSFDYRRLHLGVGYGTDFIPIKRDLYTGTFRVSVGLNL